MLKGYKLKTPFFEFGPKAYMYGANLLALSKELDRLGDRYDVDIVIDPQTADLRMIVENTSERVQVYAQHMDSLKIGRGMGAVLAEAVKATGAKGVMLNHAEKKISLDEIKKGIERAEEVGLATMVCGDLFEELRAIARLAPDIIVAEPSELIGTGKGADKAYVDKCISVIKEINPDILVLPSAGVSGGIDCYNIVKAGASGSGSSSALATAKDKFKMAEEMISNIRKAWDELYK